MKKKNRAFYRYFIPVIYAVFVYILWELTGTLVAVSYTHLTLPTTERV